MTFTDALNRKLPTLKPASTNPVLNGVADLRSAIRRATEARAAFRVITRTAHQISETRFGELEAAYLDTADEVRDALGALGLAEGEIEELGEVL